MSQHLSAIALETAQAVSFEAPIRSVPSSRLVPRPRLVAELLAGQPRLRLLCAPAGYGKSTLIRECLEQSDAQGRCVHLDLAGKPLPLQKLCARIAEQLDGAPDGSQALLEFLERSNAPLRVVLDDYPAEADAELDAWIDHLLVHSRAPLQLWVGSRQRPQWNLPRLLLDGELLELGSDALAFSRGEFDDIVALLSPATSVSTREEVWQRTLGWCAGVRLLLGAQGRASQSSAVWLGDYLERELLSRLSEDERRLLGGLAHLPRFSANFCAQLWDDLDARGLFQRLLQSQSFFQPLDRDGEWYRLLPAVAHVLQDRAATVDVNRLRLAACRLLSALRFTDEAIDLALDAGHLDVAVNYMSRLSPSWLLGGQHLMAFLDWRKRLPVRLLESTPRLVALNACALLMASRLSEAQTCLTHLGHFLPQPTADLNRCLLAAWQALHGTIQGLLGSCDSAREHCQSALAQLGESDRHVSFLCHSTLARLAMSAGETAQAQQILMDAVEQARRHGCLASEALVNSERICLMILCGEITLAELLLQENLALLQADGNHHQMLHGRLLAMQGKLHLQRGDLDACERAMQEALQHIQNCGSPLLHALTGLAEVASCRGDQQQAFRYLQDAERRLQCANVQETSYRGVLNLQSLSILVRQNKWEQALTMARSIEDYLRGPTARLNGMLVPSMMVRNQVLMARAEIGLGRVRDAEKRLQMTQKECLRLNFRGLLNRVRQTLEQLEQAQPEAAQPGESRHVPAGGSFNLLVGEAKAAQPARSHSEGGSGSSLKKREELTSREVSVLELLAEGLSNQEIGERLYISTNTVKAHTKHINHKLGVTRRTQAVVRAKAMGVLS
ncbi:LuxR C-terminal-related transcriptional regulator [Pseudomonas schmalbachii]|uniref:ATP-dependent transcriptional regulator n=1 Tax=Pseudomonas schmalbachii TaxID=2816993 RepID=A0ABS3TXJ3_9PSED|nr:LuxR C-terminal-related transcriptional regulator [Pseudomonas schmalbachii]MBO3277395.1 ATP-dependent transcriptional regulator [Pseudomonas schmalbachii]